MYVRAATNYDDWEAQFLVKSLQHEPLKPEA